MAELGLGTAALGRPGYLNLGHGASLDALRDDRGGVAVDVLRGRAHEVIDAALAGGIRWLDTARSYGLGETFVADWLHLHPEWDDEVTVSTKWGYTYTAGWRIDAEVHEVKDHSIDVLERQWAESSSLLGTRLAVHQIHSATLDTGVLSDRAVLRRLAEIAGQGVQVGLSTTGPAQAETIRAALEIEVDGQPVFDAVQATWNPLEPSAAPALAEAHDAGWTVIVKEAVANGRLTPAAMDPPDLVPGVTPDAAALAIALHQPWVDVVLSGAASVPHLTSNLRALDVPASDLPAAEDLAPLAEAPEAYWAHRSAMPWT